MTKTGEYSFCYPPATFRQGTARSPTENYPSIQLFGHCCDFVRIELRQKSKKINTRKFLAQLYPAIALSELNPSLKATVFTRPHRIDKTVKEYFLFGGTALQKPDRPQPPRAVTVSHQLFFGKKTSKKTLNWPKLRAQTVQKMALSHLYFLSISTYLKKDHNNDNFVQFCSPPK